MQTGLGGATGGFDDRFDFILTSENMLTNTDLFFVPNSYKVYGNNNNANCYNEEINSVNCDGSDYNQAIRNALYDMSDHLPVTIELQTPEVLGIEDNEYNNGIKIVGSNVIAEQLHLSIEHNAITNFTIYNNLGQSVKHIVVSDKNISVDVSSLSSGVYYITTATTLVKPLKFVIQ